MDLQIIRNKIYEIRGQQIMLDFYLAELYGIETAQLKRSVRRNVERFEGEDFMFELTSDELSRCQFGILNKGRGSNIKYLPFAFTELGVSMLSSVLNSKTAIEINRGIMRAFIAMRQYLMNNKNTLNELKKIQNQIRFIQDDIESINKDHENYEQHFDDIYLALAELAQKNKEKLNKPFPKIGYVK